MKALTMLTHTYKHTCDCLRLPDRERTVQTREDPADYGLPHSPQPRKGNLKGLVASDVTFVRRERTTCSSPRGQELLDVLEMQNDEGEPTDIQHS